MEHENKISREKIKENKMRKLGLIKSLLFGAYMVMWIDLISRIAVRLFKYREVQMSLELGIYALSLMTISLFLAGILYFDKDDYLKIEMSRGRKSSEK